MAKCTGAHCGCSNGSGATVSAHQKQMASNTLTKPDVFRLSGLDCADCAAKLEQRLSRLAGVERVEVNFASAKMQVWHHGSADAIVQTVEQSGYAATPEVVGVYQLTRQSKELSLKNILTVISGLLLIIGLVLMFLGLDRVWFTTIFLAAIITGGFYTFKNGFYALRELNMDMHVLLTVAVIGAVAIGEWPEAATAVFLFALGNTMQAWSMDKTRNSIRQLMAYAPPTALIRRGDQEVEVPVQSIQVGDVMIVKPGTRIAMDGQVLSGISQVNQAPITGESMPVAKTIGSEVFAGTFNEHGALEVKVTKLVQDNTITRIIDMVEKAQAQKAPTQQFVDVFAKYYTPAVMALAVAIALVPPLFLGQPFIQWLEKGLIMLVIACPCALVISTPVVIVTAIGSAARQGVLIKGGAWLEKVAATKVMAFDKTGTLTGGTPVVTDAIGLQDGNAEQMLAVAAAIENKSQHLLARSIMALAQDKQINIPASHNFKSYAGSGASAEVNGTVYYIGSPGLFQNLMRQNIAASNAVDKLQSEGKTAVLVGSKQSLLGIIALADEPRVNSAAVLNSLRAMGIAKTVMLTGDNVGTAQVVAAKINVDEIKAELLPEDKLAAIGDLQAKYGQVAMVGDGVNDAPALAAADVGIAMGAVGSDIALDTADIVLATDDLNKLPYTINLSRRTLSIIKQNIIFALLIKALFMVGTFVGVTNLWMAVLADTGAALLVIANGLRLIYVPKPFRSPNKHQQNQSQQTICLN